MRSIDRAHKGPPAPERGQLLSGCQRPIFGAVHRAGFDAVNMIVLADGRTVACAGSRRGPAPSAEGDRRPKRYLRCVGRRFRTLLLCKATDDIERVSAQYR